jgi:hypothetical protein
MNRWRPVLSWVCLLAGGWGVVILLLASPITAAIWTDGAVFEPWDLGTRFSWATNLVGAIVSSWRWVAAMALCGALAGLGAYLQPPAVEPRPRRVAEVRRIRGG